MTTMRTTFRLFSVLISFFTLFEQSWGKSRLGDYYLGFGYSMADGDGEFQQTDGDILSIMGESPATNNSDWRVHLQYGNYDKVPPSMGDESSWKLGIDYLMYYDGHIDQNGMFRPYFGLGLGYLNDKAKLRLNDNGFNWNFLVGTEVLFTDDLSLYLGGSFYGLWGNFGDNDWEWDLGLTWWINDVHGISLDYQRPAEKSVNFIGLKYLYSWQ